MSKKIVHKLDEHTAQLVRSGGNITNLHHAVEEMIYNSIDADATCININLNPDTISITIADNGIGISYNDLLNNVGTVINATSKSYNNIYHNSNSNTRFYGSKGEALYNLCQLSSDMIIQSQCTSEDSHLGIHHIKHISKNPKNGLNHVQMTQNFLL